MKKMLILALIALFYIGVSALIPPSEVTVDNDVGYSLTIDQNITVVIDSPVPVLFSAENEVQTIIDRGVGVPYKGLINQEMMVYSEVENFQCNKYYTIDRIDLKLPTLTGFENQPDKYPFASDLGLRKS